MKLSVCLFLNIITFLFSFLFNISYCQNQNKIDSLETILYAQDNDTNKVINLLLLSDEVNETNPEKALEYQHQAYKLSKKLNYFEGIGDAIYKQSYSYKSIGNLDSAIYCTNEYITIGDSLGDSLRIANGYFQYGNLIRRKGETKLAREYYFKCLKIYNVINDTSGLICSYNGIGITYKLTSDFDSAAYYYLKTLRLCEEVDHNRGIGSTLINLGKIYMELEDYEKARNYTKQSIVFNRKINNQWNIALAYTNLGMIAAKEELYKLGLDYYSKALDIQKQIGNNIGIHNLYLNIGNIYKEQKQYSKALEKYNIVLKAFNEIDYKTGMISTLVNKAEVLAKVGQYSKASQLYDSCLMISIETGEKDKRKEIYMSICKTNFEIGNFQKAFEYLEKFQQLSDSIYNLEKEEVIANLSLKYEKEKDQAHILLLEKDNLEKDLDLRQKTNQRNIYLFSGSGIISIILFLLIFYRHKARKDRIISEQKILQLEEEKKLLAARSIVEGQEEERKRIAKELHDGLGVLLSTAKMQFTSIKDKSPENKPLIEKATKLLEQAAGDVRKISHNMMPGLLTKFGLYEAVEDLIEHIDETEELSAKCEILGDTKRLPENTEIMLYRIIQEMVNNTIKHAKAKNIRLHLNRQSDKLNIFYSDNGIGFDMAQKLESKSLGLTSIQSRINFLNGNLEIVSKPGEGVKYTIQIPI